MQRSQLCMVLTGLIAVAAQSAGARSGERRSFLSAQAAVDTGIGVVVRCIAGHEMVPRVCFVGLGDRARRVVYVCDYYVMLSMYDGPRCELRMSIGLLRPTQSFNVIMLDDRGFQTMSKAELLPATKEIQREAYEFLDGFSKPGEPNPLPALELAFKQRPEVIYLLVDNDFSGPGNDAVVSFCRKKTADGKTRINTVARIERSVKDRPEDLEFVKALQAIARNSGGQFRWVTDEEMER